MLQTTLISPDNTWALMALSCGWVAFSIYAEQTWAWASKLSGAVVALLGAMVLTNLKIIPTSAPWFDDIIWGYAIPLAIPLLLLQCDIRKIWKESGRVLLLYLIGAAGTALSGVLAFVLLQDSVPEAAKVAAMMTGSYIGGSVNLVTVSTAFQVPGEILAATTVADNMLMACYFFVLIAIPSNALFRTWYKHPHVDQVEAQGAEAGKNAASTYWAPKPISLRDISVNLALGTAIVSLSTQLSQVITRAIPGTDLLSTFFSGVLGNKYLLITTLAMILATCGSKYLGKLAGSQEIGTYLIYLFLFVIGVPASISQIIQNAPLLFVFCFIMVVGNMLFSFGFGKLLKFDLEEIIMASNANIGGPTTAAAMAISQGWVKLVGPVMLIGTLGYVIGTWMGITIGIVLGAVPV